MKAVINTIIHGGALYKNYDLFKGALREYEGKEVEIIIRPKINRRSNRQNAYYWASVLPLIQRTLKENGMNFPESMLHDEMRRRFLLRVEVGDDGLEMERVRSTTELTTTEWEDFMYQVREWARETLDLYIPHPNEDLTIER